MSHIGEIKKGTISVNVTNELLENLHNAYEAASENYTVYNTYESAAWAYLNSSFNTLEKAANLSYMIFNFHTLVRFLRPSF